MTARRSTAKRTPAPKAAPPPVYTAAQNASFAAFKKANPFTNSGSFTPTRTPAPKAKPKRGTSMPVDPSVYWLTGANDEYPTCVSVAIANSLLAATGARVTDYDVLVLHRLCASGDGVSIPDALEVVSKFGIGGHKPARFLDVGDAAVQAPVAPEAGNLIIGMSDGKDDHAALWTPHGLISWGTPLSTYEAIGWYADGEAWFIDWNGEEV